MQTWGVVDSNIKAEKRHDQKSNYKITKAAKFEKKKNQSYIVINTETSFPMISDHMHFCGKNMYQLYKGVYK